MRIYKLEVTDEAIENLEQIYLYIAEELQSPSSAKGQYERIVSQIMKLEIFPARYNIIEFEPARSRCMRLMPIDNFAVIYIVVEEKVIVTNIFYGASDLYSKLRDKS